MPRLFIAPLLLSGVSIAHAQSCVPIALDATDGSVVAPKYHKVLYEDQDVRVLEVVSLPHSVEEMHTHVRPSLFITLEEHHPYYMYGPNGKRTEPPVGNPPFVQNFQPQALHRVENPGDFTDRYVRIEIKHPGCGPTPVPLGEQDALKVDAAHTRLSFETDDVRVLEITLPPHAREVFHTNAWPAIAYIDQPAQICYLIPGKPPTSGRNSGKGVLRIGPEGLHAVENLSGTSFHLFRVELKHALPKAAQSGQ